MATAVNDVITFNGAVKAVCLMTAQGANSGSPTQGSAAFGVPGFPSEKLSVDDGHSFARMDALYSTLMIHTYGTSAGALTGIFTLWGYLPTTNPAGGDWFPVKVNGGAAIAAAGLIRYSERFQNLGHFKRIALEIASIGGTTPQFEAWLATGRGGTF